MEFVQLQELLKKIGVSLEVLKSGEFKDIGSPHRKMSERDREVINGLISDVQDQFVSAVARGRSLSKEKVQEIADGSILSGAKAKELGLVDVLGNFQDAVDLTKKMTGIKGEAKLVYPKKQASRLWDIILQNTTESVYRAVKNTLKTNLEYRWTGLSYSYD
jgi:protease-4